MTPSVENNQRTICDSFGDPHLAVVFSSVMPLRGGVCRHSAWAQNWVELQQQRRYWVEAECKKGKVGLGGFAVSRGI
ncbi:hypothetical protein ILYODFUR_001899 [Ilyodon furcidens]|uniref:Uncharacterized protein n=1 Tax=Ilyodon furcidens TaxID=33524 RepID=A0ABV0V172_9TELE